MADGKAESGDGLGDFFLLQKRPFRKDMLEPVVNVTWTRENDEMGS